MLLQNAWTIGWCTLVVFNIVAVINVSLTTCGYVYPILLSRALTTDPYRGITLGYSLLAIALSFRLNSSVLSTAFLGFFSAFLVSMFETSAHNALIFVSSGLILWDCQPINNHLWKVHWWTTVVLLVVCVRWLAYAHFVYSGLDSKCSKWYISEYLLFWSMNLLVLWKIPATTEMRDKVIELTAIQQSNTKDKIIF